MDQAKNTMTALEALRRRVRNDERNIRYLDKALGGLCIAAMAVWARAHDHKSCAETGDLLGEVARLIGEEEQNAKTTKW